MSLTDLTPKQKVVFAAVRELQTHSGKMPTLDEIRQYLGYATVSSVQRHVDALKKKGYLNADKHQNRSLRIVHQNLVSIPLVGSVPCGAPLLAEQNIEAYVSYDLGQSKSPNDYFFLRAVGDSMNMAGIDDGDLVLVRKQQSADRGQKVVALIGDNATIKRLNQDGEYWTLDPVSTNPNHKKLIMVEDFGVQGVAVDIVKTGGKT